ncbi:ABC transporter permease [Nakamurella deserti]|uniref:ABC transporter permease n=1 Tax=Nakamurella deserti TaxID=2164074 RepID=UPI000DBE9A99|nr:ABC transporter permease subunit [Nakamurella deserti]
MTAPVAPAVTPAGGGRRRGGRLGVLAPTVPFFLYVGIFLVLPTLIVVVGAFQGNDGAFTLSNLSLLNTPSVRSATLTTLGLSAISAVTGAVIGGLLAYALATADPEGRLRRTVLAVCSVLAQFGGVMLAFCFIAAIGRNGSVTQILFDLTGTRITTAWLYEFPGLVLVYAYFQIPLMVIVFLPALDGIRPQWREATETMGGSTWTYWTRVAGPILMPAFVSSVLLLFANAFSAYATAAALISQANPLLALQIRGALSGEVVSDQQNTAKVLAFLMVVIVAIVMALYAWMQRRASRWIR